MMGTTRTGLRLANAWRLVSGQSRTQLKGSVPRASCLKQPETIISQPSRSFNLIPGKGDCKKNKTVTKCPKKKECEVPAPQCCPHPPPACASVCRTCPPDKKPSCPLPNRPPQPCHCPYTLEVKHKPGHCPGPCPTGSTCGQNGNGV